jgi:ribosomal protein S18 acetylase RimI-like enzyme
MLESHIFSKPYFDRHGLIVAEDGGELIGYVHGGFGPNEMGSDISTEMGVTCLYLIRPDKDTLPLRRDLVTACEDYLRSRGAKVLYAGGIYPVNPFYLGFYGGSELPGILESDGSALETFVAAGYQEIDRCVVLRRDIAGFRAPVDRQQVQIRRRFRIEVDYSPGQPSWWDACTGPVSETTRLVLYPQQAKQPCGSLAFWLIEPLSLNLGAPTAGLMRLVIDETRRRLGLATFLNVEAIRYLRETGITQVEAQTMQANSAALTLYRKLGFRQVDQGLVLRKAAR